MEAIYSSRKFFLILLLALCSAGTVSAQHYRKWSDTFYGNSYYSKAPASEVTFSIAEVEQESVDAAWTAIAVGDYDYTVKDCLYYKERFNLEGWGYFLFVERYTEQYMRNVYGRNRVNESRLLQAYILSESGYKVKLAKVNEELILMLCLDEDTDKYPFVSEYDGKYYLIHGDRSKLRCQIMNIDFPGTESMSLRFSGFPDLDFEEETSIVYGGKTLKANRNLMDFLNDFPQTSDLAFYAETSLSPEMKVQLYPILRDSIAGMDELAAANKLMDFVQHRFSYETDQEQFGREKTFFADETFFYPYSDCEDRSVLFSVLIRDLLGLDVILVQYPEHLATAVHFKDSEMINGSYFDMDGRKYLICDPTYIGSHIGQPMDKYKSASARIIFIKD